MCEVGKFLKTRPPLMAQVEMVGVFRDPLAWPAAKSLGWSRRQSPFQDRIRLFLSNFLNLAAVVGSAILAAL